MNSLEIFENLENENIQERYFYFFDKLIEKIIMFRCMEQRYVRNFMSIDELDTIIKNKCDEVFEIKDDNLDDFINYIYHLINKESELIKLSDIRDIINTIYLEYSYVGEFPKYKINAFYTKILNAQDNIFCAQEKEKVEQSLKSILSLTSKREKTIIQGKQLNYVLSLLKEHKYSELGTSQELLAEEIKDLRYVITRLKDVKKTKISITEEQFKGFEQAFLNGSLNVLETQKILPDVPGNVCKTIFQKYYRILLKYVGNVKYPQETFDISPSLKAKQGYNYNNFVIADKHRFQENMKLLQASLSNDEMNLLLSNEFLLKLVFFANIFPEFSIDSMTEIIKNYDKIKEKLQNKRSENKLLNEEELFLTNFDLVLHMLKNWTHVNDLIEVVLGEDTFATIPEFREGAYMEAFLQSLSKYELTIPTVQGEYKNYVYEIGNVFDSRRLLIGIYSNSCVDLFRTLGAKTYLDVLTQPDADVFMLSDKNHQFAKRILVFRKGNCLILSDVHTKSNEQAPLGENRKLVDFLAQTLMTAAKKNHDNVKYVLGTNTYSTGSDLVIKDNAFFKKLPHADFSSELRVICGANHQTPKEILQDIDFDIKPLKTYLVPRTIKTNAKAADINRIRALKCLQDYYETGQEIKNFSKAKDEDYTYIIAGLDWYLAVTKNNELEQMVINNSYLSVMEFNEYKGSLLKNRQEIKHRL